MGLAVKSAGAAIICCACILLIKKRSPEQALMLGTAAAVIILTALLPAVQSVAEIWSELADKAALSGSIVSPVAKCVALGIITRLASDLCRDSGSAAIASAVETVGCVCALLAAGPLMVMLFEMIGGAL